MSDYLIDPLAGCRAYLKAYRHQAVSKAQFPRPIITLSREPGAGAVTIGDRTAQILNRDLEPGAPPWTVFDKNLVQRVLEDHQLPQTLQEFLPEDVLPGVRSAVEEIFGLHPSAWRLAENTAETILRLAHLGHVILVGRGSNLITAGMRPAVHIRMVAPLEKRIAHLAEYYHLTHEEAAAYAKKAELGRRRYVKRYFRTSIDDPLNYTLTINTGRMDEETAARLIASALHLCAAAEASA